MLNKSSALLALLLSAAPVAVMPAMAEPAGAPSVTIQEAWARASAGAASMGAAYVVLKGGAQDDTLIGASTPVADGAMVHVSMQDNGIMKMRHVDGVPVPANQTVTFEPGGNHIMLMGLKHPLAGGETFKLTLTFAHTAPVTVDVTVRDRAH